MATGVGISSKSESDFQIEKSLIHFIDENGSWLSSNCKEKAFSCMARTKISSVEFNPEEIPAQEGSNPGPFLCKKAMGKVTLGVRSSDRSGNCFCQFKDQSLLSCAAIAKH